MQTSPTVSLWRPNWYFSPLKEESWQSYVSKKRRNLIWAFPMSLLRSERSHLPFKASGSTLSFPDPQATFPLCICPPTDCSTHLLRGGICGQLVSFCSISNYGYYSAFHLKHIDIIRVALLHL